jgi:hypothetical protein
MPSSFILLISRFLSGVGSGNCRVCLAYTTARIEHLAFFEPKRIHLCFSHKIFYVYLVYKQPGKIQDKEHGHLKFSGDKRNNWTVESFAKKVGFL